LVWLLGAGWGGAAPTEATAPHARTPAPSKEAGAPEARELAVRWEALRARFLEMGEPLLAALERADRIRDELPARQADTREAEAAFRSALRARQKAEAEQRAYLEETTSAEEAWIARQVNDLQRIAERARAKVEDLRRSQERLIETWSSRGHRRSAAESTATLIFDKDIRTSEAEFQRALHALRQAKSQQDVLIRFTQPKQAKALRAEVEARRARELFSQAAWETAKTRQAELEAGMTGAHLSKAETRLLDQMLEVVKGAGTGPPRDGDLAHVRSFLDRYEAALEAMRASSEQLRSERYTGLIDRLLGAREKPGRL
jgi:hypothetical protein